MLPENTNIRHFKRSASASRQLPVLSADQTVAVGSTAVELVDAQTPMLQLQIQGQILLLLGNLKPNEQKKAAQTFAPRSSSLVVWRVVSYRFISGQNRKLWICCRLTQTRCLGKRQDQVFWTGRRCYPMDAQR